MPRILALMAVQRQRATSRSTSPSSSEQHGRVGGDPTTIVASPSKLAHTPSFKASLGHLPLELGVLFAVTRAKKSRLIERKRAVETELFGAISKHLEVVLILLVVMED